MQHYLVLSRGNFYAENSMVTKFCHLALWGSGNYASPCRITSVGLLAAGSTHPELLPCGYLVGDSNRIVIRLKGWNLAL